MVVVLTGVNDAVLDVWRFSLLVVALNGSAHGGELHELWARTNDAHPLNAWAISLSSRKLHRCQISNRIYRSRPIRGVIFGR